MDTEKKLIGLLKDAAVIVHRFYYETNMPTKDVCAIIQIMADNYANNIDKIPVDEYSLKIEEVEEENVEENEVEKEEPELKKVSKSDATVK
ncbi:hypothetical protein [Maribellus mangrovi]|uniref:hypothetical protein n=1 Tax=Maribellus mangrovi TaxID=3133146 RepID=UPI0030ED9DDD